MEEEQPVGEQHFANASQQLAGKALELKTTAGTFVFPGEAIETVDVETETYETNFGHSFKISSAEHVVQIAVKVYGVTLVAKEAKIIAGNISHVSFTTKEQLLAHQGVDEASAEPAKPQPVDPLMLSKDVRDLLGDALLAGYTTFEYEVHKDPYEVRLTEPTYEPQPGAGAKPIKRCTRCRGVKNGNFKHKCKQHHVCGFIHYDRSTGKAPKNPACLAAAGRHAVLTSIYTNGYVNKAHIDAEHPWKGGKTVVKAAAGQVKIKGPDGWVPLGFIKDEAAQFPLASTEAAKITYHKIDPPLVEDEDGAPLPADQQMMTFKAMADADPLVAGLKEALGYGEQKQVQLGDQVQVSEATSALGWDKAQHAEVKDFDCTCPLGQSKHEVKCPVFIVANKGKAYGGKWEKAKGDDEWVCTKCSEVYQMSQEAPLPPVKHVCTPDASCGNLHGTDTEDCPSYSQWVVKGTKTTQGKAIYVCSWCQMQTWAPASHPPKECPKAPASALYPVVKAQLDQINKQQPFFPHQQQFLSKYAKGGYIKGYSDHDTGLTMDLYAAKHPQPTPPYVGMKKYGPCSCSYTEGPSEDCSQHGNPKWIESAETWRAMEHIYALDGAAKIKAMKVFAGYAAKAHLHGLSQEEWAWAWLRMIQSHNMQHAKGEAKQVINYLIEHGKKPTTPVLLFGKVLMQVAEVAKQTHKAEGYSPYAPNPWTGKQLDAGEPWFKTWIEDFSPPPVPWSHPDAPVPWDHPDADPVGDMKAWKQKMITTNQIDANAIYVTSTNTNSAGMTFNPANYVKITGDPTPENAEPTREELESRAEFLKAQLIKTYERIAALDDGNSVEEADVMDEFSWVKGMDGDVFEHEGTVFPLVESLSIESHGDGSSSVELEFTERLPADMAAMEYRHVCEAFDIEPEAVRIEGRGAQF